MIRHVFNLIWHRKRANALIIVELLVTFLILFSLTGFSLNLYKLYNSPLGFNVANTWSIKMTTGGTWADADSDTMRQVISVVEQLDEVQAAELMFDPPFELGSSAMFGTVNEQTIRFEVNSNSVGFPEALGMRLLEGRWFGPQDETQSGEVETIVPVLVNKTFSDAVGGDVLGEVVPSGPNGERQQRIIGVFEDFRQHGEFGASYPYVMQRLRTDGSFGQAPVIVLVLKVGTSPEFEQRLLAILQQTAPGWDFDVNSWTSLQQAHFRTYTIPLLLVTAVVVFLLVMVGFGLLGVLWQNIIRRTPEMGLRRAMGATANAVRLQVVLELLAVMSFALVLGILIVVQLPLTGVIQMLDWELFFPTLAMSTLILLGLCILFALYPAVQATRLDPVEALRYE